MHRQLRQADVRHRHRQALALQVAQRAAAGQVGAVGKQLYRHTGQAADLAQHRAGKPARRVLLACVDLQHNAAAHAHGVGGVGLVGKIGVHGVGVVGAQHKAVGQRALHALGAVGHRVIDAPEHIAQKQAVRALARAAADLLVVQHRPNRRAGGVSLGRGRQEGIQRCGRALQVVDARGHEIFARGANDGRRLPHIQRQVPVDHVGLGHAQRFGQQGGQRAAALGAVQRLHVHLGVIAVAVVDAAVHVRRQRGDHGQVAVQVDQPRRQRAVRPAHQHPPGHRKRPVQPGGHVHAAVAFHIELGAPGGGHGCVLDAPGGRIAVAGRDAPAADGVRRDAPGDDGAVVARDIVAAPGLQVPVRGFLQAGVARGVQQAGGFGRRVERRDARLQKMKQIFQLHGVVLLYR